MVYKIVNAPMARISKSYKCSSYYKSPFKSGDRVKYRYFIVLHKIGIQQRPKNILSAATPFCSTSAFSISLFYAHPQIGKRFFNM